ncbi:MAG: arylsulfatase [Planctomycetota bacterium]|jgi:arylsulfatase|nr:arylsulfatase [Planctomycetota bacterium]
MTRLTTSLLLATLLCGPTAQEAARPNILVIMVDDMGYSDLGCYGGEVETPHIDRLAGKGLRFSQFYNTSRCCPTRASLLTGLYPHQAGVGRMTFDQDQPGYRGHLSEKAVTIAEVLNTAGYRTAMVGKWHLSLTENTPQNALWVSHRLDLGSFSDPDTYPVGRGFQQHWGTIWGVVNFFDPFSLVKDREPVANVPEDFYYTDAITDHAINFIEEFSQGDAPFFLYVAHTAPHWPLHALPEDIAKYRDTYTVGWDAIREARYDRMVKMGLIEADTAILSQRIRKERSWDKNPNKDWDARAMAVHAAMIDRVDQGIGRILDKLEACGRLENSLILFLSDNGASPEDLTRGGPGFDRPSHTRDGKKMIYDKEKATMPGAEHTYASIGAMWANAANTPFRYWKKEQYEGGVCTPLIAHWPAGLKAEEGSITHQTGHVIDIMATCVDLAKVDYPNRFNDEDILPMEGRSLLPILEGDQRNGHDAIFFEHFGSRAVRQGRWKLVALKGKPWELYDLTSDRTEMRNLAAQDPDKTATMAALWQDWAGRSQVLPPPGGRKQGGRKAGAKKKSPAANTGSEENSPLKGL